MHLFKGYNATSHILLKLWAVAFFILVGNEQLYAQCDGISLNSYVVTPLSLSTNSDLVNGGIQHRYITVAVNTTRDANCSRWSLTVKARESWKYGNTVINLQQTAIRFNSTVFGPTASELGVNGATFPLTRNEIILINRSNTPINTNKFKYFDLKYDLIVSGGDDLLNAENGTYSTLLEFVLYDEFGRVLSTTTVRPSFEIYNNQRNNANISLQNGASNVSLGFTTAADFEKGITDTKINGLIVNAYAPHQVIVKSATSRLMAPSVPQGIPVSSISLNIISTGSGQPGIICTPITLSNIPKVVANNPMYNFRYQNSTYTLNYSISGSDPNIVSAQPGVYSTSIMFMVIPF